MIRYRIIFVSEWPIFIPLTKESIEHKEWKQHCYGNYLNLSDKKKLELSERIPKTITFFNKETNKYYETLHN